MPASFPSTLTSNAATDGRGYTVQPKDYQVASVEARAITGYLEANRVAIVYDTSTYTAGIADQVRDAVTRAGAEVVLFESFGEGELNAPALVDQIRAKPGSRLRDHLLPRGGEIAKEAAARGLEATCLMGLANQDVKFVKTAGLDAARRCYSSGIPSAEQFSGARTYVTEYREEFDAEPGRGGRSRTTPSGCCSRLFALRAAGTPTASKKSSRTRRTTPASRARSTSTRRRATAESCPS
jgi:ABC-type branched-subunit amino acid transport system substrate-binding protein